MHLGLMVMFLWLSDTQWSLFRMYLITQDNNCIRISNANACVIRKKKYMQNRTFQHSSKVVCVMRKLYNAYKSVLATKMYQRIDKTPWSGGSVSALDIFVFEIATVHRRRDWLRLTVSLAYRICIPTITIWILSVRCVWNNRSVDWIAKSGSVCVCASIRIRTFERRVLKVWNGVIASMSTDSLGEVSNCLTTASLSTLARDRRLQFCTMQTASWSFTDFKHEILRCSSRCFSLRVNISTEITFRR
jgi:hypothetical protein